MNAVLDKPAVTWPLMRNNIAREDLDAVIEFLRQEDPILTQSAEVAAFEREWSAWLGVKYSVFVNSGSSANIATIAAIKHLYGDGEIIVPTLTWVSDISAVLHAGMKPVFVDIDRRTLGMDIDQVLDAITGDTKAVFLTHVLGYNGLNQRLLDELERREIPLIEDVCESHGATFNGRRLGSFGLASNFSFYYAHHLSTIEGGMICTNDEDMYRTARMLRSHGMVRECGDDHLKVEYQLEHPDLNPDFIFSYPAYNLRNTELNAVIGRRQLRRLDTNNDLRNRNLHLFLENLDPEYYQTDFATEGCSNYAFTLVLREPDIAFRHKLESTLREHGIEFRRGASGGGNQLRQPYLKKIMGPTEWAHFPCVNHVHKFGYYIGNYPSLEPNAVLEICSLLNRTAAEHATPLMPATGREGQQVPTSIYQY